MRVNTLSASTLDGNNVQNLKGENLGNIKDLMINLHDGKIAYAVLSFGGFLGVGDKLFAIPWDQIKVDQNKECCILDIDKDRLEKAPGFDKDHWPKASETSYLTQVYEFYQTKPFWATA